ncbi:MAG: prenyltransferase/squalene oxidase repeat-containing protein [Planctomycetota bacterium]
MAEEIRRAHERARAALLEARDARGHWRGELSSSALSTATATAALALAADAGADDGEQLRALARAGRAWLVAHAGADGGFGDTTDSPSNLSTTALAWMALGPGLPLTGTDAGAAAFGRATAWIERALDGAAVSAPALAAALERIYGKDRTFAVPILSACAIGGAFGGDPAAWRSVRALPFELAALPQGLFRFLGLPVVSYALPALIAIGQAIAAHRPSGNPVARAARAATRGTTLRVLERIQPENGGFLEATPLTSFVTLSLISCGHVEHPVVRRGLAFLRASVRQDGSWPIDTDLATWGTTLAVGALAAEEGGARFDGADGVHAWLLGQQHRVRHPYTGAAPGGWAWTDLPGGVPDADDTPGALLALRALEPDAPAPETARAAAAGLRWLFDLQNRDGGVPTFCRGWGTLPFDMSCADLTAHALRACRAWEAHVDGDLARRMERFRGRATRFLARTQAADGSWTPLWFGNQQHPDKLNPVYGTSRVLRAAAPGDAGDPAWRDALERGLAWLRSAQRPDGGFGGGPGLAPTVEETALALEALVDAADAGLGVDTGDSDLRAAIERAGLWLARETDGGRAFPRSPIGLYFAQLWYHDALYPLVFTTSALAGAARLTGTGSSVRW